MADNATSISPCASRTLRKISSMPSPRRSLWIRMLVSRIRPKVSAPCRRIARLAVADDLFQISGEPCIHHGLVAQFLRARLGQHNRLGDGAVRWLRRAENRCWMCVALDDNLRACSHAGQQSGEVAGGFF